MKINVARRAELSRYKFVCRWPEGATKTGEQREERLAAQLQLTRCQSVQRKFQGERLRAKRERAAAKRTRETSPLEGVETNRRSQTRRDSDNRRRNQRRSHF